LNLEEQTLDKQISCFLGVLPFIYFNQYIQNAIRTS